MKDAIKERGRALEEAFFKNQQDKMIQSQKSELNLSEKVDELTRYTGIKERKILEKSISVGLAPNTFAAFSFFPLVYVAWADTSVDRREKGAIKVAADHYGLSEDSPSYQLMNSWMDQRPTQELFEIWQDFYSAYKKTLNRSELDSLSHAIMSSIKNVASASGGFLGLGNISDSEQKAMEIIEDILVN